MRTSDLKIGGRYYRFGHPESVGETPPVETWVYLGYKHIPDLNTLCCDKPYYFYCFKDFETWWYDKYLPEKERSEGLKIPKLKQVLRTMLTWNELLIEIRRFTAMIKPQSTRRTKVKTSRARRSPDTTR